MNLKSNLINARSSNAITGYATNSTYVYHGPDSSNYANVGSIGPNESVNILAQSMGWYHIEYTVNGTTQIKTGYVPKSSLTNISSSNISEEDFYGGYCYATTELDVRTCDVFNNTAAVGTLYKNEGCTFLFSYLVDGNNIAFIEYSTSSGTKRGYVYSKYLNFPCETIVCIAKETIPVYGGPNFETSAQLGTVYQNELMSVISKENNVIYVEYNTTKGRKRGYVDWTKVNPRDYNSGIIFNNFYTIKNNSNTHIVDETTAVPVYGGPSTAYAQIGSVNGENIVCFWTQNATFSPLTCIEYTVNTTGKTKRGYIDPSKIHNGNLAYENNHIEDLTTVYPYFSRGIYGQTQLNRDLVYYKTGKGENRIFLTFALHGWEDGIKADGTYYHGDGNMLIKIAKRFMQKFGTLSQAKIDEIQKKWTIYVFPGINLDGIANGYSNNGFGRCLNSGLDPNRNWPGNFIIDRTSPRYKTGGSYLGDNIDNSDAKELVALKNIITSNAGNAQNVLIDIHGWYNQTVGNSSIGQYYWKSFGIPSYRHSNSYGNGYLIAWAKNGKKLLTTIKDQPGIGASSCLLELPPTTDYSDANMNNYGDKFFNGTLSLLEKTGDSVGYPENYDEISFDRLYSQLKTIYDAADVYKPSASIKEKNILVLEYLRKEDYDALKYQFLYGIIDIDFVNKFEIDNGINSKTHYLHPDNIIVPESNFPKGIKISHLAACLNRLFT